MTRAAPAGGPRQRVLDVLRNRLEEGRYGPGDRLPPERDLAAELAVSRSVLRGALAVLEAEGRIWRGVGQGTYVGGRHEGPERVADMKHLTSPAEVMEVRLALEPELARLAAHRASSRELDEVERCWRKAAAARTQETYELWDGRIHHAVACAAHNRLFLALFEALNAVRSHTTWGQARQARRSTAWQQRTTQQHEAILNALRSRDAPGAQARMRDHLQAVRDHLLGGDAHGDEAAGAGTS